MNYETLLLPDCKLASKEDLPLYAPDIPVPIEVIGSVTLSESINVYSDRRFIKVRKPTGEAFLIYRLPQGFAYITLTRR